MNFLVMTGAALFIGAAFLTFRVLEQGRSHPTLVLYVLAKAVVLAVVSAFIPSLLIMITAYTGSTSSANEFVKALLLGITVVLPSVYIVVAYVGARSSSLQAKKVPLVEDTKNLT